MATKPIDTAKVYALTAAGACSITLTQGNKSITWVALSDGGQTSFIVPAGATFELSDSAALISPLPANFKAALGTGVASAGGERIVTAVTEEDGFCSLPVAHAVWCSFLPSTSSCRLAPASVSYRALSMTLMLNPDADMRTGWLSVPDGVQLVWLYGEPAVIRGHTYIIGITQLAPDKILANLLATF